MLMWALIVLSCAYGDDFCNKVTTYYHTEQQCGDAAAYVQNVAEREKPDGIILYRCEEELSAESAAALVEADTAATE